MSKTHTAPCGISATEADLGELVAIPLTKCCGATGTGSDTPTGVACRGCYETVSSAFGSYGWEALHQAAASVGCPCPDECATELVYKVLG